MRINRIHIDSYGSLKDRDFRLGRGLNVFYGPNESGKTTTMEFIRNTLSPTTKRNLYPESSKLDSGSMRYSQGDDEFEIVLEQKSVKGKVPDIFASIDPQTYRSLFAMNSRDLDDMTAISSGDIRSRFLTIPGGESVPQLITSLEEDMNDVIGKTASSPSEINRLTKEEAENSSRIADLRSNAEEYSELKQRSAVLEEELKQLSEQSKEVLERNRLHERVEAQRPAVEKLKVYKDELSKKSSLLLVDEGSEETYRQLKEEASQKKSAYQSLDQARKSNVQKLGCDESAARSLRPNIESVLYRQSEYEHRRSQPRIEPAKPKAKPQFVPIILLAFGFSMFLLPGVDILVRAGLGISIMAAGVVAYVLTNRKVPETVPVEDGWIASYESEVSSLMGALGLHSSGTNQDLRTLSNVSSVLSTIDSDNEMLMKSKMDYMSADNRLIGFLSRYKGEAGYQEAIQNTKDVAILKSKIEALENTIRTSGFDPDLPLPEVEYHEYDDSLQREKSEELGKINERMKTILDTKELDSLIDKNYSIKARKERTLIDGAVTMLSSLIVQDACTELYESVHPEVICTADRYLSMMTSGLYRFDIDPRNTELTVISGDASKGIKKWSTGLRSQVLLSIKLAIAKEMGGGEIPVILDDVLLPFDSVRKKGACEALSLLSDEMQILLFTCDDRVPSISSGLANTTVIEM